VNRVVSLGALSKKRRKAHSGNSRLWVGGCELGHHGVIMSLDSVDQAAKVEGRVMFFAAYAAGDYCGPVLYTCAPASGGGQP
jgi:hypothetical protein